MDNNNNNNNDDCDNNNNNDKNNSESVKKADHKAPNGRLIHKNSLYSVNSLDIGDFSEINLNFPDPIRSWLSEEANLSVRIRNVCLTYGSGRKANCVLNNLSMSVPAGTIYGLLGPSGCGKTTLLGIISGLIKPETGLVKVFGYTPGSRESGVPDSGLGYMPQDVSLQADLTVHETLWYFGRLYFLPNSILNKRIERLIELLDIPDANRLICNLSGGQQRRVSLACSIIHKPRLAILDEPTCGVDPLLCHRIWQLLRKFCSEDNMTIIITTHYIEDCRKASMVGFMRAGEILEENSPEALMECYKTPRMEEIFYKICFAQKRRNTLSRRLSIAASTLAPDDKNRDYVCPHKSYRQTHPIHTFLSSIYTLIWRYLIQSLRSPVYLLLLFFFPLASLITMYICVGHAPFDVPVGWVIEETPDYSGLHVRPENFSTGWSKNRIPYYPDEIYNSLDHKMLKLIKYSSLEDALVDVRNTKISSTIYMRQFFSESFHDRADLFTSKTIDNNIISRGTIWVYADLTDRFMVTTVMAALELALLKVFNSTAPAYNASYDQRALPIEIGDTSLGDLANLFEMDLSNYLAPGLIISSIFSCAFALSSLALIAESGDKMFVRNYSTGLSPAQIIASQLLSRFIFLATNGVIFLLVSVHILGIPCLSSPFLAVLIIWLQALAGCSGGVFFGSMFPKFESALFVSIFAFGLVSAVSGLFWSFEALPYYLKTISFLSPFTQAVISLRNVMIKVNQTFYSNVLPGITTSIFWVVFFNVGSVLLLRRKMFST